MPWSYLEENLFLTHRTNICPVPQMKIGGTTYNTETGEQTPSDKFQRMTLHWSLVDTKPNVGYIANNIAVQAKNLWGSKGPKYIAIEPVASVKNLFVGGWVDDLYMIGPHVLSKKSVLITPVEEKFLLEKQGFNGEILAYDPNLTTSEEVFEQFTKNKIKNLQLQVRFPLTSNLERLEAQFGKDIADLLRGEAEGLEIAGTFDLSSRDIVPISFQKTHMGYIFTTDRKGLDLCNVLTINSSVSISAEPGQMILSSLSDSIALDQLFSTAPWIHSSHEFTPFGMLEKAISQADFHRIQNLFEDIKIHLVPKSEVYHKLIDFQIKIEELYNISSLTAHTGKRQNLSKISLNKDFSFFDFKDHTIKHRHENQELQALYDINFGLVVMK